MYARSTTVRGNSAVPRRRDRLPARQGHAGRPGPGRLRRPVDAGRPRERALHRDDRLGDRGGDARQRGPAAPAAPRGTPTSWAGGRRCRSGRSPSCTARGTRPTAPVPGCVWSRGDPADRERVLDAFRMTMLPRMEELPGFCSVSMLVDLEAGRAATATVYESRDAMNRATATARADARGVHRARWAARSPRSASSTSSSPTCGCPRRSDGLTASTPDRARSGRAAGRTPARRRAPAPPGRRSRRASPERSRRTRRSNSRQRCAESRVDVVRLAGGDGEVPAVHQHLVQRDHAHRRARQGRTAGTSVSPPRPTAAATPRRARRAAAAAARASRRAAGRRRPTGHRPATSSPRPAGTRASADEVVEHRRHGGAGAGGRVGQLVVAHAGDHPGHRMPSAG